MTLSVVFAHVVLANAAIAMQVVGDVKVEVGGTVTPLVRFAQVAEGATVSTGADGRASLRLPSGSLLRLGPETHIALTAVERGNPAAKRKESVRVVVGRVWAHVMGLLGTDSRFDVATSNAVAGVRGTSFWVTAQKDRPSQFVLEHGALAIHRGDIELLLDRPGASAAAGAAGLSAGAQLDAWALAALRRDTGGAGASLVSRLGGDRGALLQRGQRRHELRQVIVAPDMALDSPVTAPRVGDEVRGLAEIRIRVLLPAQ
ncbi:MAG: FecR family protein [Myxococcota bacterium]